MENDAKFVDKTVVRIDKSLSSIKLYSIYNDNDALIRDMIIFLARGYQHDLFNYTIFDPTEFCKLLGWNRNRLSRSVKPEFINPEYPDISDNLGMALLELLRTHIEVPIEEKKDNWGSWGRGIEKIDIIQKVVPLKGNKGKKLYQLQISDSFKENLNNFYFQINIDTYASLKIKNSTSLQELYLFGMKLKNKILNNEFVKKRIEAGDKVIDSVQSFSKLAETAQLSYSEAKKTKFVLAKAFKQINDLDPQFKIHLVFTTAPNANYAYTPVLKIEINPIISKEEKTYTRISILDSAICEKLIELYRAKNNLNDIFTPEQEVHCKTWMFATNSLMVKTRAEVFASVYSSMMPYKIDRYHHFATHYGLTSQVMLSY